MKRIVSFLKKPFRRSPSSERGIALVFTLGILGLLIIVGLAFSSGAITERKAAYNNDARSLARILAQSGLNRAVAAFMYYSSVSDSYDTLYSHDETSDNKNTYDYLFKMSTSLDGFKFEFPNTDTGIQWQYVMNGLTGSTDSTCPKIIGRFAYVVIPGGGRLEPSDIVDTYCVEDATTRERPGVDVSEIYAKGLAPSDADLTSYIHGLSDNATFGAGCYKTGRWPGMSNIFSLLGISALSANDRARVEEKWNSWFSIASSADSECYWEDTNGNDKLDDSAANHELFKRFNLARPQTDWDALTVADVLAAPVWGGSSGAPGIKWLRNFGINEGGSNDNSYCGTFADVTKRRCQIAANLLDYCKSFAQPVTCGTASGATPAALSLGAVAPSSWETTAPDFTGNKRTFYLNEFGVQVKFTPVVAKIFDDPPTNSTWHYNCSLDMKVLTGAELINIYGGTCNTSSNVELRLKNGATITCDINLSVALSSGSTPAGLTVAPPSPVISSGTNPVYGGSMGTGSYFPVAANFWNTSWFTASTGTLQTISDTADPVWSIKNLKVTVPGLILQYSGGANNRYDYAKVTDASGTVVIDGSANVALAPGVDVSAYVAYQAIDPRQNLNSGDWGASIANLGAAAYNGTPGVTNGSASPATHTKPSGYTDYGSDPETAGDPSGLSTAFIREGSIQSPWELGCIHRGFAWETLNLKEFNTFPAYSMKYGLSANAGGARYAQSSINSTTHDGGDANILDHVKMTDQDQIYGKVNLKTASNDVLKSLFYYLYSGSGYATPGQQTGEQVEDTRADNFAAAIRAYMSGNPIKSRAMIANAERIATTRRYDNTGSSDSDSKLTTKRLTDAAKEEIIGKMVNLTKIGSADYFSILVIAQSIKDAGTYAGIPLTKDLDGNGSIANATLNNVDPGALAGTARSGVLESLTCKLGFYDFGFDEIISEQKIYAVFQKNASGHWRITRFEFVDPSSESGW